MYDKIRYKLKKKKKKNSEAAILRIRSLVLDLRASNILVKVFITRPLDAAFKDSTGIDWKGMFPDTPHF